ncbi:hypothetical protein DFA_11701 [Cavenderia fasciculata]|uniref:Uncharacterized protein n=1 Tax=Cavenderia fasciculata TaxID=261658 RepID=F4QDZ3_CACFS|nr:uncharacterized protein DFA_11701 [Cavenderia fasciculata]EGG13940.1 hypothetical protein DFA_11701 [Cavenderia fasciculata]|eukprot:XP_004350648.1 hypothetical protein DFA_11701 [Cavenderia fasciculata]
MVKIQRLISNIIIELRYRYRFVTDNNIKSKLINLQQRSITDQTTTTTTPTPTTTTTPTTTMMLSDKQLSCPSLLSSLDNNQNQNQNNNQTTNCWKSGNPQREFQKMRDKYISRSMGNLDQHQQSTTTNINNNNQLPTNQQQMSDHFKSLRNSWSFYSAPEEGQSTPNLQHCHHSFSAPTSPQSGRPSRKDGYSESDLRSAILEPLPHHKATKIEELVKGRLKEKLGRLLNNEEMEKQGKAFEKGATTFESTLQRVQRRAREHINMLNINNINTSTTTTTTTTTSTINNNNNSENNNQQHFLILIQKEEVGSSLSSSSSSPLQTTQSQPQLQSTYSQIHHHHFVGYNNLSWNPISNASNGNSCFDSTSSSA